MRRTLGVQKVEILNGTWRKLWAVKGYEHASIGATSS